MATALDITTKLGGLGTGAEWEMYSYDRPAYMLWNAIANGLHKNGWSEEAIKDHLQSRDVRHALDGALGDSIRELGEAYAEEVAKDAAAETNDGAQSVVVHEASGDW